MWGMAASSIHNCLKKQGFSYKKKTTTYLEANQEKRKRYLNQIHDIPKDNLVYLDEMWGRRNNNKR